MKTITILFELQTSDTTADKVVGPPAERWRVRCPHSKDNSQRTDKPSLKRKTMHFVNARQRRAFFSEHISLVIQHTKRGISMLDTTHFGSEMMDFKGFCSHQIECVFISVWQGVPVLEKPTSLLLISYSNYIKDDENTKEPGPAIADLESVCWIVL